MPAMVAVIPPVVVPVVAKLLISTKVVDPSNAYWYFTKGELLNLVGGLNFTTADSLDAVMLMIVGAVGTS
jgi:hypothetical protein